MKTLTNYFKRLTTIALSIAMVLWSVAPGLSSFVPTARAVSSTVSSQVDHYTVNGRAGFIRSSEPQYLPASNGTVSQTTNDDGSVTMNINGASNYADSGFYTKPMRLGDVKSVTVTGSGSFGVNIWLDTNSENDNNTNGKFFTWNSDVFTSTDGDGFFSVGPVPQDNTLTINDGSSFDSYTSADTGTHTFASLKAEYPNTDITFWVGTTALSGGTQSATISTFDVEKLGSLAAQDFGVWNSGGVNGYSAGFKLTDATFTGATSIVVQLFSGNTLLQTDTATTPTEFPGLTQISSPFDVFGTFNYVNDEYWTNVRASEYGQTMIPTRVVATVTLANGKVVTAENTNLTGDLTTLFPTQDSPATVDLLSAGNYAILAKTAVTTTGETTVTGDIGISPAFASDTTGFGPVLDSTGCFSLSDPSILVSGKIYAADYNTNGCATPAILTTSVSAMEHAYTEAAGRPHGVGPNLNIGGGTVATQTLAPGVYTWGSNVTITGDITLSGSATDVWIFQISGTLDIDAGKQIILSGEASPKNIFWQVADAVTLKPGSHLEGNILAQTNIAMQTGATLNGRALAQTAVTLDGNTITAPTSESVPLFILTYTAGANGTITGATSQAVGSGLNGTEVTAVPATGYHFVNWSDDSTANPRTDTNVTGDLSVTATFAADPSNNGGGGGGGGTTYYNLNVTKTGTGSGSVTANGSTCNGSCSFPYGTTVTLTATPVSGSSFSGWTGACSGSAGTCSVVLNGNQTVGASFILGQVLGEATGTPASLAHVNGTLILDGQTIYLIKNQQRFGFRDEAEYLSHGYKFSQAVAANAADKLLPAGDVLKAMTGTVVLDGSDGRTVYLIGANSVKRGFTSAEVFTALGYSFAGLPIINLADYPAGDPIASSTAAHPEGALVLDSTGTVWWVLGNKRGGFESLTVFNTYGFTFSRVVPANAADMALAEGSLVKLRDGTLVSQGGVTYIISDGQKLQFASALALTSRGYNAANVVPDDVSGYSSGSTLQ